MSAAVSFSLLLCQKLLFTCVCVCVNVHKFVRACVTLVPLQWSGRPHLSAPWDSCTPPRGLRQQACPSLPATFLISVFLCAYLLNFSSVHFVALPLWAHKLSLHCFSDTVEQANLPLTAFPHRACVVVAHWRYSPDTQWLRCEGSINEQQIRTGGEGKQQQYLGFPLQRALFLDRKIGQVRAELLGRGW